MPLKQGQTNSGSFKKGQIPHNKGIFGIVKQSKETIEKRAVKLRGKIRKPRSQEWCKKLSKNHKGGVIHHSVESKKKIGLAHLGMKHTDLARKKIRLARAKQVITKDQKIKISNKLKTYADVIRERRLHQVFPKKDSEPERMVQLALQLKGIKFEKHKAILGQPDIFIDPNNCIFIDGCYWHGCQKCFKDLNEMQKNNIIRDFRISQELNLKGYNVIRIREHDIRGKKGDEIFTLLNDAVSVRGW